MVDFDGVEEWSGDETVEVKVSYTLHLPASMVAALRVPDDDEDIEIHEKAWEHLDLAVGEWLHVTSPEVEVDGRDITTH